MSIRTRINATFVLLAVLTSLLVPGFVSEAQAQRFPFLIQPVSIEDLGDLAKELELSREQQAQMMQLYDRYQAEYEQLQERDVSDLMDQGLAMGQSMGSWMGGEINIPARKDIEELLDLALEIYDKFNRIDKEYFDSINTLVIEEQLPALERARRRRKLSNYIMPHFMLAGRFNEGIGFNLLDWIDRTDLSPEQVAMVRQVTDSMESRMLYLVLQFQDDLFKMVEQVLDLVDELGLREMDMQQMMQLMGQGLEERLRAFFDENSKSIQKTIEKMARLNHQTAMQIREVIGDENWVQLTFEFSESSYNEAAGGVQRGDRRFDRAMKLEDATDEQILMLESAQSDYRGRWLVLFPQVAEAFQDQRAYRTSSQMEGDAGTSQDERVDRMGERAKDLVASGDTSLRGILTTEQMELLDGENKKDRSRSRWSRRRSRSETPDPVTGRTYSLPIAPMEPASVEQFSAWLGLQDVDESVLESLYDQYSANYDSLSNDYDSRLTEGYAALDGEGGNWRERRKVRRALQEEMLPKLKQAEDDFFTDMAMVLPPETRPDLLDQIRVSHDRARRRQKIWNGNWSLRGSTEGTIDIGEIVLAIDPETLDQETRELMVGVMIEYNAASMEDIDAIEKSYDRVKGLESQLWGEGRDSLDEDLRQRLYERWEAGRSKMSEVAASMAETNRQTYEGIVSKMPEDRAMVIQDMYERKAYPDVFSDDYLADEQIQATLELEGLTTDQRERINDLALDYRSDYRDLTTRILEGAKGRQKVQRSWPPSSDSMKGYMKMEQLRYRRRQLSDQTRLLLEIELTDQQIAMVPGLGDEQSKSDEQGS
ncbi:MAG: hypothetical protein CMJ24_03335 [Phycisphaerae bacterium]|nr:hypothetical protein [Phycisphaerae bacterium]|tara:strand:- start:381 stop:2849 length:2469 start_codon:yes stop_codon:yes gene_type:complete